MTEKKTVFSLCEVLDAIDSVSDETRWLANVETGRIAFRSEYDHAYFDDDDEEDFEDDGWIALPGRFDVNDWAIMRDYALELGGTEGDELLDAIHGRGAFRAFRRIVERLGALQSWYAYRDMRHLEIAFDWLKEHNLTWKDDVHESQKRDWRALLPVALATQLEIEILASEFSVCKLGAHDTIPAELLELEYCFISRTPDELSVVCETVAVPAAAIAREDGWRAFKVAGPLDFGLVGILAKICSALADAGVPVFAISTYDTDYVLVKAENLTTACNALKDAGALVIL